MLAYFAGQVRALATVQSLENLRKDAHRLADRLQEKADAYKKDTVGSSNIDLAA